MAIDRFVRWGSKRGPKLAVVKMVLEDYLGDAAISVEINTKSQAQITAGTLLAKLHGKPRFPFRRVPGYEDMASSSEQHGERWIEVYVCSKYVDVITRFSDEYTNVVARGFAELSARFWKGKIDPYD